MKNVWIILLLLISPMSFANDSFTTVEGQAYKTQYQFSTFSDWITQKDSLNFNVFSFNPLTKKESISLIVESLKKPINIQEYTQANLSSMKSLMKGFRKLKTTQIQTISQPHQLIEYKHEVGGQTKQAYLLLIRFERYGVALTSTAPPGTFDDFQDDFLKLLGAFQIKSL